jgi:hypothetical protein
VPRQQRVKFELSQLADTRRRFLNRAIVNVLEDDLPAAEHGVTGEEIAPLTTSHQQRHVTIAVPGRLENFEGEVANRDTITLAHLV